MQNIITNKQRQRAEIFKRMHTEGGMFVLPNVWNAMSAKIFENHGFGAVATSSAGIAFSLGYPDGELMPFENLIEITRQITNKISIPLSVDFEAGYGDSKQRVKENAKRLLQAGAVGFNIEDGMPDGGLLDLDKQLEKIIGLTELKQELDLDFVINARTCAYWLSIGSEEYMFETAAKRCNVFLKAGADCVFVPGFMDDHTIERLVNAIDGPLNIIFTPGCPDFNTLRYLGVKRLSVGSAPVRSVVAHIANIAKELRNDDASTMTKINIGYKSVNDMFK